MNVRRLLLYITLGFATIIGLWWLYNYLTTGRLVITTNSGYNSITLTTTTTSTGARILAKQTGTRLSIKLKTGNYIASISGGSIAASELVKVKAHSTQYYAINPLAATGVEPVVTANAHNIAASSSRLLYLNSLDANLYQIDSQNLQQQIASSNQFQFISWADSTYGVGLTPSGQLLVINNDHVSALATPVLINGDSRRPVYTIAPDRYIYLAVGSDVYGGTESAGLKKIYGNRASGTLLVSGSDDLALIDSGDARYSTNGNSQAEQPSITVINRSGKITKRPIGTFVASWSLHDKYLAISSSGGGEVLDGSLQHIGTIPQANFTNPTWLNDNTLLYSVNDQLWSYDLWGQKSQLVANMPLGATIAEMKLSDDKNYIFMVLNNSNGTTAIKRMGLQGQKVPDFVYQLQSVLPETFDNYSLELINFRDSPPTILVDANPGSDPKADLQAAQASLQNQNFDISKLELKLQFNNE